jgi:hypothetical protein
VIEGGIREKRTKNRRCPCQRLIQRERGMEEMAKRKREDK